MNLKQDETKLERSFMMENKIKSFIYLDNDKMYSISSQLFEGLTEYIMQDSKKIATEDDQQKKQSFSGKLMREIYQLEKGSSEKRFFHDYAYSLFEKELIDRNLLCTIEDDGKLGDMTDKQFVKVHGKAYFNDYRALRETFCRFNEIGSALGYIQCYGPMGEVLKQIDEAALQTSDRNQKAKIKNKKNAVDSIFKKYLQDQGLNVNEKFTENLVKIYEFGYKDMFAVHIPYQESNIVFATMLNREYLKEKEDSLIAKYSRRTEVEFTIVGLLTQCGGEKAQIDPDNPEGSMKEASLNFTSIISNLEDSFNGRLGNEYIIDPIAIYREI